MGRRRREEVKRGGRRKVGARTDRHETEHHVVPRHLCTRAVSPPMRIVQTAQENQIPNPEPPNPKPQTFKLEVHFHLLLPPPVVVHRARAHHRHARKHAHCRRQISDYAVNLRVRVKAHGIARRMKQPPLRKLAPRLHLLELLQDGFRFLGPKLLV